MTAGVDVARARWAAQGLDVRSGRGALRTVRRLVALQAQVPSATALAVRARTTGVHSASLAPRLGGSGGLVRTWLLRGTIHVVAAEDAPWLRELLAADVLRGSRRRYAQLGLDAATLTRAVDVLADLVAAGPRRRSELFAGLGAAGIDPVGQRGIHLVAHAAWHGALCFRPDRDGETAWGAPDRPTAAALDRASALVQLATRYHRAYGGDARDLAAWSGLAVTEARGAWRAAELPEGPGTESSRPVGTVPRGEAPRRDRSAPGVAAPQPEPGAAPAPHASAPVVRLLPHFDPYLVGYRGRDHAVPQEHTREVWTGGGFVLPTVVRDGFAVGTWRMDRRDHRADVSVLPFRADVMDDATRAGIGEEVDDIGRFLGVRAGWGLRETAG